MAWQRKILRVNLTKGTCTPEPLNMQWAQDYLGQRGLATKYFCEEVDPEGRSAVARQQADLRHRPADRHDGLHRRALLGHHQGAAHRRDRLLELRRLLRRRAALRRLGHDHLRGQVAEARLPAHRERQGDAASRRRDLGQEHLGHRGDPQEEAPGSADRACPRIGRAGEAQVLFAASSTTCTAPPAAPASAP